MKFKLISYLNISLNFLKAHFLILVIIITIFLQISIYRYLIDIMTRSITQFFFYFIENYIPFKIYSIIYSKDRHTVNERLAKFISENANNQSERGKTGNKRENIFHSL